MAKCWIPLLLLLLPLAESRTQDDSARVPLRTIDEVLLRNDSLIVRGTVYSIERTRESDFSVALLGGLSQLNGDVNDGATFPGAKRPWLWTVNLPAFYRFDTEELPLIGETDLILRGGLSFNRIQGDYPGYSVTNWVTGIYAAFETDFRDFVGIGGPVQPFLYAGPAYVWHSPNVENVSPQHRVRRQYQDGTGSSAAALLFGGGLRWQLTERVEILAGYEKVLTFTDALDHFVSGLNDNIAGLSLGLRISFVSARVDTVADIYESSSYYPPPTVPQRCDLLDRLAADCAPWRARSMAQFDQNARASYRRLEKLDSDGDGLSDADELHFYGTNPRESDSDLDGLTDLDEVVGTVVREDLGAVELCGAPGMTLRRLREELQRPARKRIVITNPASRDTDQDGIDDRTELCFTHTDPCRYDTDGDGLGDYLESFSTVTDPLRADSDGDGLGDCEEMLVHGTNPLLRDTDFDAISDSADVHGSSVRDMQQSAEGCRDGLVLERGITFASGSWELGAEAAPRLSRLYEFLLRTPAARLEITGFADSDPLRDSDMRARGSRAGERNKNIELSERRARAVAHWLTARRIPPQRLVITAGGPLSGEQEEVKRANRRVEVTVLRCR